MRHTIQQLLGGDERVVRHFQRAKEKWKELFNGKRDASLKEWADWLSQNQMSFFELQCGGRCKGQEIMAWSAFGCLYTTEGGFGQNTELVKKLINAFRRSLCSIDVKDHAREAARFYRS